MANRDLTKEESDLNGEYREQVLIVEPHGIERVQEVERHGNTRSLFTLWLSANMGLPVWLVWSLAVIFGLGFAVGVVAILVVYIFACSLLALSASMAPGVGLHQLPLTRHRFGSRGASQT